MQRNYYVYILSNKHNTVLYTGITNDLLRRIDEHRRGNANSFTKRYNIDKLLHYEVFYDSYSAICREKQIKRWSRKLKDKLIARHNPELRDLAVDL